MSAWMSPMSAPFWTLTSCTCNSIITEMLTTSVKNSSFSLLTFATFLFMAIEGFIRHPEFLAYRHIPIRSYAPIIFIFFIINLANNRVLGLEDVPFPLIIIFRSGTLVANVILTWLLQNRRYSPKRVASILIVTFGIVLFTLSSSDLQHHQRKTFSPGRMPLFFIGIFTMSATMIASAYLGILQEQIFMLHGKYPEEMMFYVHLLSLPLFLLVSKEIKNDMGEYWNAQGGIMLSGIPIPTCFIFLLSSIILQFICIRSVYLLTAHLNSLHVTMLLTLRKFLNILFSVLIFKNEFGLQHLISTTMILIGSFTFYDGHVKLWHWIRKTEDKKSL